MITRHDVAHKLTDYLHHRISLPEIVHWAETAMLEGDFDDEDYEIIRDIVSRLGLVDVQEFALTWEDFEAFLRQLGYQLRLEVVAVT
jgi:hypothetical protein